MVKQQLLLVVILFTLYSTVCNCQRSNSTRYKQQFPDRFSSCPNTNICGDGECVETTHPLIEYKYVCKCRDGTYKFDTCSSRVEKKCSNNPCYPYICIEAYTAPKGYICQCGQNYFTNDYCPNPCKDINLCRNGAVCTAEGCKCPSGYYGKNCEFMSTQNLCDRIYCKQNSVCSIVESNRAQCSCRAGTAGPFCEVTRAAGRCNQIQCYNQGICEEHIINGVRSAYCFCRPGYTGTRCETEYFRCFQNGNFQDLYNCDIGRYLECANYGTPSYPNGILNIRQCPHGLRFNPTFNYCDYPQNVDCTIRYK